MKSAALTLLLVLTVVSADAAAPIYRCGPDGRIYSQAPCADGKLIESADPRSAAQRAEALRVAAKERQTAADMERERRKQQAEKPPAQAVGFNSRPPPPEPAASSSDSGARKRHHSKAKTASKDFVAIDPGAKKKKRAQK